VLFYVSLSDISTTVSSYNLMNSSVLDYRYYLIIHAIINATINIHPNGRTKFITFPSNPDLSNGSPILEFNANDLNATLSKNKLTYIQNINNINVIKFKSISIFVNKLKLPANDN